MRLHGGDAERRRLKGGQPHPFPVASTVFDDTPRP